MPGFRHLESFISCPNVVSPSNSEVGARRPNRASPIGAGGASIEHFYRDRIYCRRRLIVPMPMPLVCGTWPCRPQVYASRIHLGTLFADLHQRYTLAPRRTRLSYPFELFISSRCCLPTPPFGARSRYRGGTASTLLESVLRCSEASPDRLCCAWPAG
jgi:hypothetical protein